jgi:phosphohistidine phosphatase
MKRLTVLRHAKSSWEEPNSDDFDRPLNDRGWAATRRVGHELKQRGMHFDLGLASPAARVRETLDGVAEGYGEFPFPIRFEPRIYEASVDTLLDLVRNLSEDLNAVLLVGHNPGLERLLVELSRDDKHGLRDRVARKYPTAALAVVELPAKRWAEIEPGTGTIVELLEPRELD